MRSGVILTAVFCLVAMPSELAQAWKRPIVPTMKDVAITWWGETSGRMDMLLDLDSKGVGAFVLRSGTGGGTSVYRIRATRLATYAIEFEVEAVAETPKDLVLRGHAYRGQLDLKLSAKSLRWKDEVRMRPWSDVTTAIQALQTCHARLRATAATNATPACD